MFPEFTQGMILPTMNGESVEPAGRPALKPEERKVSCAQALDVQAVCRGITGGALNALSLLSKPVRPGPCCWCL